MASAVSITSPMEAMLEGSRPDAVTLGIVVSVSGVMGVTGPGILSAARLAAEQEAGLLDRPLRLVTIDAGRGTVAAVRDVDAVSRMARLDGLVGAHTSDVRIALERSLAGRLPYVFTPPHELDRTTGHTVFTGDGPIDQMLEPIRTVMRGRRARRWALVGNDYVWPRAMHSAARSAIPRLGGQIVYDRLVPLGAARPRRLVDGILHARPDAVLVSLIGRDGILFHRAFAAAGASRTCIRLCTALDENCLLSVGGDDSGTLFCAMPFLSPRQDDSDRIRADYRARYGTLAPAPGAYAIGCYNGVRLLAEAVGGRTSIRAAMTAADATAPAPTPSLARATGTILQPLAVGAAV